QRNKADYQARPDSVEAVRSAQLIEIIDLPIDSVASEREFVSGAPLLQLDHPPLETVYVRWRGHLYGPLQVSAKAAGEGRGWMLAFAPRQADHGVLKCPEAVLDRIPRDRRHDHLYADVSLNDRAPHHWDSIKHTCKYHLVRAEDFRQVIPPEAPRLVLESSAA